MRVFLLLLLTITAPARDNPILFVGQVPNSADFITIGSTFGNHRGAVTSVPRGGGLFVCYPDGSLKELTAGIGDTGFQGADSIAVRDPCVHWDGTKALFSMIKGSPAQQYQTGTYFWQLYEVSGLANNDTPVITRVPNQAADANNVAPVYGSDDRIIFASDRMRDGLQHHYPQLDEYEEAPTVTGLWSLDPTDGDLFLMEHSPSGSFTPIIDSYGRVIFTRWDHLQRDQQADADSSNNVFGTFNYTDESDAATPLFDVRGEVFPEPREGYATGNVVGHRFNVFFPWMINQDGTGMETLNHIGRHELSSYFNRAFSDDPGSIVEFIAGVSGRANQNPLLNLFQMREDPQNPGLFLGTDAPEFATHAAAQLVTLTGAPDVNPDLMTVDYLTHPDTRNTSDSPGPNHSGLYRDPLPTSDGLLIAAHTAETRADRNDGSRAAPTSRYSFRLTELHEVGDYWEPDSLVTPGITRTVRYYDPNVEVNWTGTLWEMQPVEIRSRPRPAKTIDTSLSSPEQAVFDAEQVEVADLKRYLADNELALLVARNVTIRDAADRQQPFNLKVADSSTTAIGNDGRLYEVAEFQIVQGDLVRGVGLTEADGQPDPGRRVLAQFLHDSASIANNSAIAGQLPGSVEVADDGSVAAFVPARRALSWQLTDPVGEPLVRERYWLSFQPGEIRTCTSCHGANRESQAELLPPTNQPLALTRLLRDWKERTAQAITVELIEQTPTLIRLRVRGKPGWAVELQTSAELETWTPRTNATLPTEGEPEVIIEFPIEDEGARLFFRIVATG